jgi:signal transduction histidine kinase
VQTLAVAFTSIAVLVTGIVVAARAMFISSHDLSALVVVVAISAAIAVGAAMQLGQDIGSGARQIEVIALELGDQPRGDRAPVPGPLELTSLADRLEEASARLEESTRRERALESSRRELIAWVSHDLRSPLASIRAMAEALDDEIVTEDETVDRYHAQIRQDAERLTTLVDDLFELSRIHSGSLRLDPQPVMLGEVVGDAVGGARAQAELKGVHVVERIDDLPEMEVAARELTRVLRNLLDNAIRHSPEGGTVLVESFVDDGGVTFAVTDECGGIPEPDLTYRGDVARRRDQGGGGLGLAIAKGLVEAHDGSIEVANRAPGCCFTVRLGRPE